MEERHGNETVTDRRTDGRDGWFGQNLQLRRSIRCHHRFKIVGPVFEPMESSGECSKKTTFTNMYVHPLFRYPMWFLIPADLVNV